MKFAHTYHDNLALYPSDWQAASIQYRQLKKCIKRVSRELTELGLDVETLKNHLAESEASASGLQYMFDGTPP
jgi:E3 ubiquitin-protein ligase BAH